MKKLLTLATVLLIAQAAQAISFSWGPTGGYTYVGSTKVGGITATLIYLGEGNSAAYSIGDWVVNNPTARTSSEGVATTTSNSSTVPALNGKVPNVKFALSSGSQVGSESTDLLTPGSSTFGLFLTYTDSENVTWYNVSSSTYTLPAGSTDITTGLSTTFAFDWTQNERGVALTSGGGWSAAAATPIPEPGTAAMALLGLGLLIRRRKA